MTDLIKEHFSKLIRSKRDEKKWTQQVASDVSAISNREYSNLERGTKAPDVQTLINRRIVYGIDLNEFVDNLVTAGYVVEERKPKPYKPERRDTGK